MDRRDFIKGAAGAVAQLGLRHSTADAEAECKASAQCPVHHARRVERSGAGLHGKSRRSDAQPRSACRRRTSLPPDVCQYPGLLPGESHDPHRHLYQPQWNARQRSSAEGNSRHRGRRLPAELDTAPGSSASGILTEDPGCRVLFRLARDGMAFNSGQPTNATITISITGISAMRMFRL